MNDEMFYTVDLQKIVNKFSPQYWKQFFLDRFIELEDFRQECYVFIFKYKKNYNPNCTFSTHIVRQIKCCAMLLYRDNYKIEKRIPPYQYDYNNYYTDSDGQEVSRFDNMTSPYDDYDYIDTELLFKSICNKLKPGHKKAIELLRQGFSCSDVAEIIKGKRTHTGYVDYAKKSFIKQYNELKRD